MVAVRKSSALCVTQVLQSLGVETGGPAYSVPGLSVALARRGAQTRLRHVQSTEPAQNYEGVDVYAHGASAGRVGRTIGSSHDLWRCLLSDARAGAILHTHGLWLMANIYPADVKRRLGGAVGIVHSPRGMLGPAALKISAWKKRPFWWLWQRAALQAANCIHATAHSEYAEIRIAGLKNPVTIIPNGIDLPDLSDLRLPHGKERIVLSIGRIHPKKGLDRLVRAWGSIEKEFSDWRLLIIGPAERNHDDELRALASTIGAQRISIQGPVYGAEKFAIYRAADLFVLPTLNENFAMTVAEALATEVPAISTKGAPWAGLDDERCGWWIDHGVSPLASAMRNAMQMERADLQAMGRRGRIWMARDFSWDRNAIDMLAVYDWISGRGPMPSTVLLD